MNKIILFLVSVFIYSCSSDNDVSIIETDLVLQFSHNWNNTEINKTHFNADSLIFTTEKGQKLSIEKLRYLISDIKLINARKEVIKFEGHKLINATKTNSLTYKIPKKITEGTYEVCFTFGLNSKLNISNKIESLNNKELNVADKFGGGYYFMQLEGKYKKKETKVSRDTIVITDSNRYQYYTSATIKKEKTVSKKENTSFFVKAGTVHLKENTETIEIQMNVAEWFKNPETLDLEELNINLTQNYKSQIKMNKNGRNVFSIKKTS